MDVAGQDRPRVDRPELEARDHAEVAAAAAQRPQKVRIAVRTGHDPLAGGGHEFRADEVVAGEALDGRQPADPAAERQAANARVDDRATDDREVVAPRGSIDVLPASPAGDANDAGRRIDRDVAPIAQVDDQGLIGHRVARDAVSAAADRDREAEVVGRDDRRDHVVVVADPDDHGGTALDRCVEGGPGGVVVRVIGGRDAVAERFAQAVDDELFHHQPSSGRPVAPGCRDKTSDLEGAGLH